MKIGIMTFWWSNDNYGQLLQCYALQKYLRDLGHDAFLIRYNYTKDIKKTAFPLRILKAFNPYKLLKHIKYLRRVQQINNEQELNDRHFDDFRTQYLFMSEMDYYSYAELKRNPPSADAYIVGSDQIWNHWSFKLSQFINPLHAYFLDFGKSEVKRLSYAASWGMTKIEDDFKNEIVPLLKRFDFISVREESGTFLCHQCGRDDAEWVCDPTLLLSAEVYRNLYSKNTIRSPEKAFILFYMLNSKSDFDIQSVYKFADSKNLEVIYVTGNGVIDDRKKYFATIPEWLYLVDHADYVITNSFHCAVFSTIFHKQFGVIKLTGDYAGMNERMNSLFRMRGIESRFVTDSDFSVLEKKYEIKEVQASKKLLDVLK